MQNPSDIVLKCTHAYLYIPNGNIYVSCRPLLDTMYITEAFQMEEWEEIDLPSPDIIHMLVQNQKYLP